MVVATQSGGVNVHLKDISTSTTPSGQTAPICPSKPSNIRPALFPSIQSLFRHRPEHLEYSTHYNGHLCEQY